jgi:hypothetical protein
MASIGTDGSEYWRTLFLALAGAWVTLSIFRGWTQGILRQLLVPLAMASALVVVVLVAPVASGYFRDSTSLPAALSGLLVGAFMWFFIYNLLVFLGGIIFKRTRDQDVTIVRLFFGAGGAFVAIIYALLQIWLITAGIRVFGKIAEDQIAIQSSRAATPHAFVIGLARLKNSLELGSGRAILDSVDPVPQDVYQRIEQGSRLLASPRAIGRLFESPALRSIWENPRVRALQTDPEILEAVRRGDFLLLVSNPKVIALWSDPSVRALLSGNQIQAALDYADGATAR